jgi:hypothetical protein
MATVTTVSPQQVAREFAYQLALKNQLKILKAGIPDFSAKFKDGASGRTVKIPKPAKFLVGSGSWDVSSSVNNILEGSVDLAMPSTPYNVAIELSDDQGTLDFQDLKQQAINPMSDALAAKVESVLLASWMPGVREAYNSATLDTTAIGQIQAKMDQNLCPTNNRKALVDGFLQADLIADTEGFFNAQGTISAQNKTGEVQTWYDFEFMKSTMMPGYTTGSRAASTMAATVTEATAAFSIDVGSGTETVKKGEVFYVAAVNQVNPQTKETTAYLRRFVVAADAKAVGGVAAVTVTEKVYADATDSRRNVDALPQSGAAVYWVGATSSTSSQGLFFHPSFAATAFADLTIDDPKMQAIATVPGTKMKIRYEKYRVGRGGYTGHRFDVLFASALVEDAFACKFIKNATVV